MRHSVENHRARPAFIALRLVTHGVNVKRSPSLSIRHIKGVHDVRSQWTIGAKLGGSLAAFLAFLLILSYSSLRSVSELGAQTEALVTVHMKQQELTLQLNRAMWEMRAAQRGLVVFSMMKQNAQAQSAADSFRTASSTAERLAGQLRSTAESDSDRRLAGDIASDLRSWAAAYEEISAAVAAQQFEGPLSQAIDKAAPIADNATRSCEQLGQSRMERAAAVAAEAAGTVSSDRWIAFVLIAATLLLGCLGLMLGRQINAGLRRIASEMAEGAGQVAGAATQVSSASQALAQGASEQSASLEETSASSEEITSMTRKNAENSRAAAEFMADAARKVEEANRTLGQMVASMREINASSDKIGKIIKVIDEIAFQTNILALNAAVEAARAGEAGMGFAVVADEVRNLAQRSAQAAKDTATLIEESIAKSSEGSTRLDQVAGAIRAITGTANQAKTLVDEVKVGSEEQARGIEQISRAIAQMEQVTQKTAANAEESASAGEEMSAQAGHLNEAVERLRTMVGGSDGAPTAAAVVRRRPPQGHTGVLRALERAVGHRKAPVKQHMASVGAKSREALPLDEDFKEF